MRELELQLLGFGLPARGSELSRQRRDALVEFLVLLERERQHPLRRVEVFDVVDADRRLAIAPEGRRRGAGSPAACGSLSDGRRVRETWRGRSATTRCTSQTGTRVRETTSKMVRPRLDRASFRSSKSLSAPRRAALDNSRSFVRFAFSYAQSGEFNGLSPKGSPPVQRRIPTACSMRYSRCLKHGGASKSVSM